MGSSKFMRPKEEISGETTSKSVSRNLYVANCGPAVGLSYETISTVFSQFGDVIGVYAADDTDTRVIVSFADVSSAQAAFTAFNGSHCSQLANRYLHIRYSVPRPSLPVRDRDFVNICLTAEELNIPGLHLFHDFITPNEEEELLAAVDSRPWISLAKRRVQHHGYEFCYQGNHVMLLAPSVCLRYTVRYIIIEKTERAIIQFLLLWLFANVALMDIPVLIGA